MLQRSRCYFFDLWLFLTLCGFLWVSLDLSVVTLHFVEILLCAFAAVCVHFMLFVLVSLNPLVVIIQLL